MPVRMAAIQKSTNNKCWRGCRGKGTLLHCWWECKLVQPLWGTVWRFLKKLEIELPYDPAIPLLGIHTEETRSERDTCTPMFIATLFIIARTWKQPRCPSADEWIRKLWYIYIMEYSVQFSSVQLLSHVRLCNPMNRSTPGLPVHHKLPEFTQTHAHQVSGAIQPSHPLSSPSPPAPNPSQHQGLFQWVNSSHEVAKVLEFYYSEFIWISSNEVDETSLLYRVKSERKTPIQYTNAHVWNLERW